MFIVEITDAPDALARLLCLFAVMQAQLAHVEMRRSDRVRLEVEGLDDHRSAVLARRLGQSIVVRAVSLGWRSAGLTGSTPEGGG